MLYRVMLRNLAIQALISSQTYARDQVYSPRTWPTDSESYPCIQVMLNEQRGDARPGASQVPQFVAVGKLQIVARLQETVLSALQAQVDAFAEQIELALMTNQPLLQSINRIAYVEANASFSSTGRDQIAELTFEFGLEYPIDIDPYTQAPTVLAPIAVPLSTVAVTVDAVNVFDASGTYPNPPFPGSVTPAPRTAGPDGRTEAGALINLPQ